MSVDGCPPVLRLERHECKWDQSAPRWAAAPNRLKPTSSSGVRFFLSSAVARKTTLRKGRFREARGSLVSRKTVHAGVQATSLDPFVYSIPLFLLLLLHDSTGLLGCKHYNSARWPQVRTAKKRFVCCLFFFSCFQSAAQSRIDC